MCDQTHTPAEHRWTLKLFRAYNKQLKEAETTN